MDPIETIVLALVQALTEFLPVSSSGHLILIPEFLGWAPAGLAFDVALHMGTLIAVIAYFRADVLQLLRAWFTSFGRKESEAKDARMAWGLGLSVVPASVIGLSMNHLIEAHLRSPATVAVMLAVFGVALWLADRWCANRRSFDDLHMGHYLILGLAQALALVPGTSRSGVTMTAARMLGLPRVQAARISFLMAIPVIALAGTYETIKWAQAPGGIAAADMLLGVAVAAISGYACIHWFMKLIGRIGFGVFAIYRLALAAVILLVLV